MKNEHTNRTIELRSLLVAMTLLAVGCATTPGEPNADGNELVAVVDLVRAGDDAARQSELEDALTFYLRAVNREESAQTWLKIGAVCTQLGRTDRAIRSYLRAVHLDPSHAAGHEALGLEYLAVNSVPAAKEHLTAAVDLDPARWRAHNGLGVLADQSQDYAVAIAHYQAALAANVDSPMLLNNLGYSRYLSGDLDQAARDFYRVTELSADYAPAWANLGLVYARRAWYGDALGVLARVSALPVAYNEVGYVAMSNGDLLQAEQLFSEAVRLSPSYYEAAYRNLELVRVRMRTRSGGVALNPGQIRAPDELISGQADES